MTAEQDRSGDKKSGFDRVIELIEDVNTDRYGKPLVAALHLCNDLADELEDQKHFNTEILGIAPQKPSESPTPERRIDNLRRIAADDSVNAFARSICMEAADRIGDLERELAAVKGVAYNAEKCVCRMDEGGTVISLCGAHQAHFDAAQSAIAPLEKEKP